MQYAEMSGLRFNNWTVISYKGNDNHGNALWRCRCDYGTIKTVRGYALRNGHSKSCGCLRAAQMSKHHAWGTRLYHIWAGMKRRCNNKSASKYGCYGGRGIKVCPEWENSFPAF